MVVRLQCKSGRYVLESITSSTTLGDLQRAIHEKTGVPPDKQKILQGYPPKEIGCYNDKLLVADVGIKAGDTVTLQELQESRESQAAGLEGNDDDDVMIIGESRIISKDKQSVSTGELRRKVVPADNSCLFTSINILTSGNMSSNEMRQLAASIITSEPHKYSDAVLGRPRDEYIQWILKDESWGGGVELLVFSELYQIELIVVDIQTLRLDRFGQGYSSKGFLIYDGIHYDPLVLFSPNADIIVQRLFPGNDDSVTEKALNIARESHKSRQFTDLSNFSLRCLVCDALLKGPSEAQDHATKTTHINFGEV